jgi:hypothetical protein
MAQRQRHPSRIQVAQRRRAARKAEAYIVDYEFPNHIGARVRRKLPQLSDAGWELIELGFSEWFICCAWRGQMVLGMPSRAVDEAWHEFILDTPRYLGFCTAAFGGYLHHTPDETMSTPMPDALAETVRAWDRSEMGAEEESVLWDLDRRLGIDQPFAGVTGVQLGAARSRAPYPLATGWVAAPAAAWMSGGCGTAGGCSGGGDGGGGGGCGGGGG